MRDEGGGSQKVTNDDKGEGGVSIPPKNDDIIYEQPLNVLRDKIQQNSAQTCEENLP